MLFTVALGIMPFSNLTVRCYVDLKASSPVLSGTLNFVVF
jgi:hypothetical protein